MRIKWNKNIAHSSIQAYLMTLDHFWSLCVPSPFPFTPVFLLFANVRPLPATRSFFTVSSARKALPLALCCMADWWLVPSHDSGLQLPRSLLMIIFYHLFYFLNSTIFSLKLSCLLMPCLFSFACNFHENRDFVCPVNGQSQCLQQCPHYNRLLINIFWMKTITA